MAQEKVNLSHNYEVARRFYYHASDLDRRRSAMHQAFYWAVMGFRCELALPRATGTPLAEWADRVRAWVSATVQQAERDAIRPKP